MEGTKGKRKMKKLMIALAAVAVAAVAQAASINWTVAANSWYLSDGTTKAGMGTTVYLINAASWDTIETAIKGGATSFTTADTGILAVGATANAKGLISESTATSTSLIAGTSYDFAYLVFDTTDASDVKYFASASLAKAAYDPTDATYSETTKITFMAAQYTTSTLSGGWQSAAVPEPTSGLLMLLGMAGLALRRKRA